MNGAAATVWDEFLTRYFESPDHLTAKDLEGCFAIAKTTLEDHRCPKFFAFKALILMGHCMQNSADATTYCQRAQVVWQTWLVGAHSVERDLDMKADLEGLRWLVVEMEQKECAGREALWVGMDGVDEPEANSGEDVTAGVEIALPLR